MFSSLKFAALAGAGIAGFTGVVGALALAVCTGNAKRKRRPSTDEPIESTAPVDDACNHKQAKRLKESTGPPVAGSPPDGEELPADLELPLEDCSPFPLLQLVDQPIFLDVCKVRCCVLLGR